ncbi:MAG: hypothetical protein GY796_08345 [Chloroflexi bacterium]|nr:hypothetical protein [Chloroflexota bacterium]
MDYENLPGKSKGDKGRELIAFLERRGRVSELICMIQQVRSDALQDASNAEPKQNRYAPDYTNNPSSQAA